MNKRIRKKLSKRYGFKTHAAKEKSLLELHKRCTRLLTLVDMISKENVK